MKRATSFRLAWLLLGLESLVIVLTAILAADGPDLIGLAAVSVWIEGAVVVGAVVAGRRADNPIGWLLIATGLCVGVGLFAGEYAIFTLGEQPGSLPFGVAAAWLSSWLLFPGFVSFLMVLILFPKGRFPSRRWRLPALIGTVSSVAAIASLALLPGPIEGVHLEGVSLVDNPLGIEGATEALDRVVSTSLVVLLSLGVSAIVSHLVRLRRAGQEERQQLKWFVYGASVLLFAAIGNLMSDVFRNEALDPLLGFFLPVASLTALPVAIGIAILRYRLYDIDVIINRTLVYGALTILLGLVYVAGTFVIGGALRSLAGQTDEGLAVAASTLAVAALFRPARSRIQGFIDRRFYRRKYDAAQTLEAFSARLRDQVDLDALRDDLLVVVRETVQPAHASLWFRGSKRMS